MNLRRYMILVAASLLVTAGVWGTPPDSGWQSIPSEDAAHGIRDHDDYERAKRCGSCHTDIYQQWMRAVMNEACVHHWYGIEYFEWAVPHAEIKPKVTSVEDGCKGCDASGPFGRRYSTAETGCGRTCGRGGHLGQEHSSRMGRGPVRRRVRALPARYMPPAPGCSAKMGEAT